MACVLLATFLITALFQYLGTTITNQNFIQEEFRSRLKSRYACYDSVQNLLSFNLLPKNLKINIHKTIILSLFCMSVKLPRLHNLCTGRPPIGLARFNNSQVAFSVDSAINVK